MIGDRVFVNNATMGLYAKIVQSPEYRDQKARTALDMLPEMIGPHAEPFDLRFTLPDGSTAPSAHLILVSNGRYQLSKPEDSVPEGASTAAPSESLPRRSATRRSWHVSSSCSPPARNRYPGWQEWTDSTFEVHSAGPIEVGIDGEAMMLDPPIRFRSVPAALRVRLPARTRILAGRVDAATWAVRDHGVVAYGPRRSGADRRLMAAQSSA